MVTEAQVLIQPFRDVWREGEESRAPKGTASPSKPTWEHFLGSPWCLGRPRVKSDKDQELFKSLSGTVVLLTLAKAI